VYEYIASRYGDHRLHPIGDPLTFGLMRQTITSTAPGDGTIKGGFEVSGTKRPRFKDVSH
jgi:hypothetical protein